MRDRRVAAWGALRANWIYLKVGARWGLGFRKGRWSGTTPTYADSLGAVCKSLSTLGWCRGDVMGRQTMWSQPYFCELGRGTEGSNPLPSSAEAATNLVAAGGVARGWDSEFESALLQRTVRLSPAATFERREPRLSARVCEAGLGAG